MMNWVLLAAIGSVVVAALVLISRSVRIVVPGWKYEFKSGGKVVKVLEVPGLYFVNPFLAAHRVRVNGENQRK